MQIQSYINPINSAQYSQSYGQNNPNSYPASIPPGVGNAPPLSFPAEPPPQNQNVPPYMLPSSSEHPTSILLLLLLFF
jgi:hypothetical protein